MNKREFLKILKDSLEVSLEKDAIKSQLDYYDKYISDEINKGRTEKEVLDELGDPRLIAKTIKTVSVGEAINESTATDDDYNKNQQQDYNGNYGGYKGTENGGGFKTYYNSNSVIGCTIAFLVFFIIVYGILRALGYLAYGLGSFALSGPIGFILVMGLIYMLFFGGRGR